ncbi:MAG: CCA tRNA nucleotidyltransferase [Nitrososphaerota archaeon]|nr:CCA tRNA nucleotidyltransferase [Candidatus Calditenuaceae archaeon]MDW8072801.1 CCA tRNA nucleotidyltransferase [Nitrososphaerota archaeon]
MAELEEVLAEASLLVEPDEAERLLVSRVAERLLESCRERFLKKGGVLDVSIEGSVAKDTWVRGRGEVDVFIHFSKETGRDVLESTVLNLGREVIEGMGGRSWLRYASHPYIEGEVDGVRVNIVGCFKVTHGRWMSPVDRTPFHTAFVKSKLTSELRRETRLFKGFLIGNGLYGAEIKTEGFSGYLSELLVIRHDGFVNLLRSASEWKLPVFIDLTEAVKRDEALRLFPNAPIIFTDPVDPSRNVAAAVSLTKLAELMLAAKLFIESPSLDYFKPPSRERRDLAEVDLGSRCLLGVLFRVEKPSPPDIFWGEIKHTMRGISRRLEKEGFHVYRSAAAQSGEETLMVFELSSLRLPEAELRVGPPVWTGNALDFVRKSLRRGDRISGPWVDGERLYALLRRRAQDADELLKEWIKGRQVAVSSQLLDSLRKAEILTSEKGLVERLDGREEFIMFLEEFLDGVSTPIKHFREAE